MSNHTPTPWEVGNRYRQDIFPADARPVKGGARALAQCWGHPYGTETAEANARLIVRAVNCHEELTQALEDVLAAVAWTGWSVDDPRWKRPMAAARAALAKARGDDDDN